MRAAGIVACLLYLLAAAPTVVAQTFTPTPGLVGQFPATPGTITLYVSIADYSVLATSISGLDAAIRTTIPSSLSAVGDAVSAQTVELSKRYAELREVQGQLVAIMGGISASHQDFVIHSQLAANSIKNMDLEFSLMRPIFTDLRNYLAAFGPKVGELNVSMQGLTTSMNQVGATVSTAIATSGQSTANQFILTMGPKLDAIRNALMSNGMPTNNISITSTNGDITMTNNIEVKFPELGDLLAVARKQMQDTETFAGAKDILLNPPTASQMTEEALASNPIPAFNGGGVDVNVGPLPTEFMRITVPNPMGGAWIWDLNPMTHFPQQVTGFRTGLEWALTLAFLMACGKLAHEFMAAQGATTQIHGPNVSVVGNNLGIIANVAYIMIYVSVAAYYSFAVGGMFSSTGGSIMSGAASRIALNPFGGFGSGSVYLADMFLPLQLIVGQTLWLLTSRYSLLATHWVCMTIIRRLPA